VLTACMIDGFGWFKESDYRRSWLFFDEVRYVLPEGTEGPIVYPPWVFQRPDYRVTYPTLGAEEAARIVESAGDDAADPSFRNLIEGNVPAKDREYAVLVVESDRRLREAIPPELARDWVFALALLINKLILCAASCGAVPIVGRRYAPELIARKIEKWAGNDPERQTALPGDPKRVLSFAAFAAGLSFDFLSDDSLVSVPMDQLTKFKQKNQRLLEKHQLSILEVVQKYHGLGEGQDFLETLSNLRLQAAKQRQELDEEARDAWLSMGLEIAKKAVLAASAGAITGIAVLRGHSLADLIGVGIPAVVSGVGVAAAATIDTVGKIHQLRRNSMAYLFETQKLMSN